MIDPAVIDSIILLKLLFSTISPSPFYMEELDMLFSSECLDGYITYTWPVGIKM